jgi:hypothetical protein
LAAIFVFPVVWVLKMNLKWKAIASVLMILIPLGRAMGLDRVSDVLRGALGKDQEDKGK